MSQRLDQPSAVREGEQLDASRLSSYLQSALGISVSRLKVQQFPSGHSNLTYLVEMDGNEWVLRRPPFGSQVKGAHDMGREFRILSKLSRAFPKAPEPIVYCDDESVLGAPFYLMNRLSGTILRARPPRGMMLEGEGMRRLCEAFIDTLAELHALDVDVIGLGDIGKLEGYNRRQVEGWTRRYQAAKLEEAKEIEELAAWLGERIPKESAGALVHNDYKLDNVILDAEEPSRILGVLDWEMSTLGDPLMDLGTSLAYWVEAADGEAMRRIAFGPTMIEGAPTR